MRRLLRGSMVAVFWLVVWQVAALLVGKPLLLPSPVKTGAALFFLMQTGAFWGDVGLTLLRVGIGYLCGVASGCALGCVCARFEAARLILSPVKKIVRATPVSSFIILVLLWLEVGVVPAFIAFLMVLPIVWESVEAAVVETDKGLLEMARAYRFSRGNILKSIYLPSVLPTLTAGCVTGLGFAWKSAIAAEVIARPLSAIGARLQDAKVYLETPQLFAWTVVVVVLSMLLEAGLKRLMRAIGGKKSV